MPELQPQIAELLRTCVHPSSLLLRVAHVELLDVRHDRREQDPAASRNGAHQNDGSHRYATKFVLTDGQLMVQALLHRKLSGLRDAADVSVGDLLDIRQFSVKKSPRLSGRGRVVYLAIEDCHFLLQPFEAALTAEVEDSLKRTETVEGQKRKRSIHDGPEHHEHQTTSSDEIGTAGGLCRPPSRKRIGIEGASGSRLGVDVRAEATVPTGVAEDISDEHMSIPQSAQCAGQMRNILPQSSGARNIPKKSPRNDHRHSARRDSLRSTFGARTTLSDNDDDDFFEEASVSLAAAEQRRQALQKLDSNAAISGTPLCIDPLPTAKALVSHKHKPENVEWKVSAFQTTGQVQRRELNREPEKEHEQAANPAQPESKRDGTFALSQTAPRHLPQQQPVSATQSRPARPSAPAPQQQTTAKQLLPLPPFHSLRSLRNPLPGQALPTKNYTVTTLAFISWTGSSLIHRPGSPFPPKRHLKIVDPSLASSRPPSRDDMPQQLTTANSAFKARTAFEDAVTVAVYINAPDFKPAAGTLALFRGLVMQRLGNGDIILNAYGRLKDQRFDDGQNDGPRSAEDGDSDHDSHWLVTNQDKIRAWGYGSRLDYYLDWWNERHRTNESA